MDTKALFLDRDGIINEDTGYVFQAEQFKFNDEIFELCRAAIKKGYIIIVVTNQSGIERGYFTESDFQILTQWMITRFESFGVEIADVLHCPQLSGYDRKPSPGMFLTAQNKHGINMSKSVSLGDKERDVQAGKRAGVGKNVLLVSGIPESVQNSEADCIITTLHEMESLL